VIPALSFVRLGVKNFLLSAVIRGLLAWSKQDCVCMGPCPRAPALERPSDMRADHQVSCSVKIQRPALALVPHCCKRPACPGLSAAHL